MRKDQLLNRGFWVGLFFAAAYYFGLRFYESEMDAFGYEPSLFPASLAQIYLNAYRGVAELFMMFLDAVNPLFGSHRVLTMSVLFVTILLLIPLWPRLAKRAPRTRMLLNELRESARASSSYWPTVFVVALPMLILVIAVCLLVAASFDWLPQTAGHSAARRNFEMHGISELADAIWKSSDGAIKQGKLRFCSEHWCAVVVDGQALAIPSGSLIQTSRGANPR